MEQLIEMQLKNDKALLTSLSCKPLLLQLPLWEVQEQSAVLQLARIYKFGDYLSALKFVNRVAELAEKHNHHPALTLEWGKVTVSWWTHSLGGLHLNDFILAAHTEQIYNTF